MGHTSALVASLCMVGCVPPVSSELHPTSNVQPSLAIPQVVQRRGLFPSHASGDPEIGDDGSIGFLYHFAGPPNEARAGTSHARGQSISISQENALFAILGTTYGGDGRSLFALPSLGSTAVVGEGHGPDLATDWHLGATHGSNQLSVAGLHIDNRQQTTSMSRLIRASGVFPRRSGPGSPQILFQGQLATFGGNYAPQGWLKCEGQILPIQQYQSLFGLLGNIYGGDGRATFGLPDLRGRVSVGADDALRLGMKFGGESANLADGHRSDDGESVSISNYQPSLALNYLIAVEGIYPGQEANTRSEPILGQIVESALNFAPAGWAFADGSLMSVQANTALFSIIGTVYGGDGRFTFGLPDLRGRTMLGTDSQANAGAHLGSSDIELSVAEIPGFPTAAPTAVPTAFPTPPSEATSNVASTATPTASLTLQSMVISLAPTSAPTTQSPPPTEGAVRLAGGTPLAGRVEIFHGASWGTICDDYFGIVDAEVVCRQLGLSGGVPVATEEYGAGSGPIWLDNVDCGGHEEALSECGGHRVGANDCRHYEDVGVECEIPANGSVRLVGGTSTAGRVEIFYGGSWGTICDDNFGTAKAEVVCRQLGLPGDVQITRYGDGSGPIWLDDVDCDGDEQALSECHSNGGGVHNCGHSDDVGIECQVSQLPAVEEGSIRLAGGTSSAGRVEIFHDGTWGTVCDDNFGIADAEVVCRQLGLPGEVRVWISNGNSKYGNGNGPIWLDDVDCDGDEQALSVCHGNGWGVHNCEHSEDVGVECQAPCSSTPPGWANSTGATCQEYKSRGWCTTTGEKGPGWKWCCECGGGSQNSAPSASDGGRRLRYGHVDLQNGSLVGVALGAAGVAAMLSAITLELAVQLWQEKLQTQSVSRERLTEETEAGEGHLSV